MIIKLYVEFSFTLFFLCRFSWPLYLVKGSSSLAMKKAVLNFNINLASSAHWLTASCLLNAANSRVAFSLEYRSRHILSLRLALCLTNVLCFNCVVHHDLQFSSSPQSVCVIKTTRNVPDQSINSRACMCLFFCRFVCWCPHGVLYYEK